jgi:imidazolonepropionase-like amidohydrolase
MGTRTRVVQSRQMLRESLRSLCLAALVAVSFAWSAAQTVARAPMLVFLHVTVINPGSSSGTGSVEQDRAVVIRNGRITAVTSAAGFAAPVGAQVVDASGKYVIPGLWDMHVHTAFGDWFPRGQEVILPLFIANGITGVRDMGGDLPVLFKWRKEIAAGEIAGPRMVVSGPMLDGYLPDGKLRFPSSVPVMTPADAVKAVDSLKAQGVDFIKVQSVVKQDVYAAAAEEAHKQGLPFVGHVPDHIKITESVALGQKSIEHFMGVLEGCSSEEDKLLAAPTEDTKLLLSSRDEAKCQRLIALLAQTHTWQCPTMAWNRQGTLLDQVDFAHQPLDKYVPVYWRDVTWKRFYDQMMPGVKADALSVRQQEIAEMLRMIGVLHNGGVEFLAGTDTAPGIYVMPGFSLHDELANFVEAGFTPMDALATATSNPAKFFGKDDMGAVAPGNVADVVVLEENPLKDIRNVDKISAVVADGRYYDRTHLDGMLAGVEKAAKR